MSAKKRIIIAAVVVVIVAAIVTIVLRPTSTKNASVSNNDVKIGVLLGFTGPIESLTPDMAASAELAMKEVSESGQLLGGRSVVSVRGDSTCTDSAAATAAAERLVTSDNVVAIMGADCSGVTTAVANNVAVPHGVVMISPSATSPALSDIADNGFFFRTAPSDARQGQVLADILTERGIQDVAITYTKNDYGKGLTESFSKAFDAAGGSVAITVAHEDGKADYSAEVGALAASGAQHLVVFGYVDQGGKGIIQAALEVDAFSNFILADGMVGESLIRAIGDDLNGAIATSPGTTGELTTKFHEYAKSHGVDGDGPFRGESYDSAAVLLLAMQAARSSERNAIQSQILNVANAPGEEIEAGELAKALKILAEGGEVNYVGATNVEFNEVGEVFGSYKEMEVTNGKFKMINVR